MNQDYPGFTEDFTQKMTANSGECPSRPADDGGLKWRLLQNASGVRPWASLDETRHCVLCEQTFSGRQVGVEWSRAGVPRLRCPTPDCPGTPAQWIHPGNPLISEEAWRDWVRLLDSLCDEPRPPHPPFDGKRKSRPSRKARVKLRSARPGHRVGGS